MCCPVGYAGLGKLSVLPDELVLQVLHDLEPAALCRLAVVSKAFYCFCYHEDNWRELMLQVIVVEVLGHVLGNFNFKNSKRIEKSGYHESVKAHKSNELASQRNMVNFVLYGVFWSLHSKVW